MDIKKELQDLCDRYKAEAEKILEKAKAEKKAWRPVKGENFYSINAVGEVYLLNWIDQEPNKYRYAIGNCFPTKEAAEFAVEKLKVIAELKRFAEEHNEPIDWKDSRIKCSLCYDHNYEMIQLDEVICCQTSDIYFSSKEIAKAAIEAIGEERLKKYYFEVEG